MIELKQKNLDFVQKEVACPLYSRDELKIGIVHIGVGGFHRAHQAFYADSLMNQGRGKEWAICGVGLRESDRRMYDILLNQDCLYTLMVKHPDGNIHASVIGSVVDFVMAPDNPQLAIRKMAAPNIKIVSLTITEGGYNFNSDTGDFNFNSPDIQWDLKHIDDPKTVFGYLAAALKSRMESGLPGFTIQSCDNIQHNGDVTKKMLLAFVGRLDRKLSLWIEDAVSFPNSMVDRITPVTCSEDIEKLRDTYELADEWPVVCEPFCQWVIEDAFCSGRPDWETVGAQFVSHVDPYEKMKLRLLNAGHSLLGFLGTLSGHDNISQAVKDPLLRTFLRDFMDEEVTPILAEVKGINIQEYKDSLIERFENPYIKDHLSRICSESSAKIPKFILPTLRAQLEKGGSITRATAIVATWCRYLELAGSPGYEYEVQDQMRERLQDSARASANGDPLAFLKNEIIFDGLSASQPFVDTYTSIITELRRSAVGEVIEALNTMRL